jgi:hypothetical protein
METDSLVAGFEVQLRQGHMSQVVRHPSRLGITALNNG